MIALGHVGRAREFLRRILRVMEQVWVDAQMAFVLNSQAIENVAVSATPLALGLSLLLVLVLIIAPEGAAPEPV